MSGGKMKVRRARIAVSQDQRESIFARAREIGAEPIESLIDAKVPSPHWRFLVRGEVVMHYWPATERYWMLSDGAKGKCELANVMTILDAEVRDLRGVLRA